MIIGRRWFVRTLVALCAGLGAGGYAADDFPSKSIRIIVPFAAGTTADLRTRQLGPLLSAQLKQNIVVENRPGAAGNLGSALAAKAPPDGYTLLYITNNTTGVNPHLYRDAGFDPVKDFTPIIVGVRGAAILVVKADGPVGSAQDFMRRAKAAPGKLTYGTSGAGSPAHLMGERLKKLAGIDLVAVPYKGDAPALADLIGGQIDSAFGFTLATLPHLRAGKLRALAVTGVKRLSSLPEVPTLAEAGVAGYDEMVWTGYAAPAQTPAAVVAKLHEAFRAAMLTPEFTSDVEKSGAELALTTQGEASALVRSDYERYRKIVKELDLRVE